jgi:hypothetical protein
MYAYVVSCSYTASCVDLKVFVKANTEVWSATGIPTFENKFFVTHPGTSDLPNCNTIIDCADFR